MLAGRLLVAVIAVAFLLPGPARAQEQESLLYVEQAIAPAAVRQGDFALRLAEELGYDLAEDDENGALHALAGLGVQPVGGWQPDQAMTPLTVEELRAALADAMAAGRIAMDIDTMWTAFNGLLAEHGLPLPAAPPPAYAAAGPPVGGYGPYCDTRTTHYFYGSYGMPIYSYCYPPSAFMHYYSWVPCGFNAHGHYFAGFFVIRHAYVLPRAHYPRYYGKRHDGRKHARSHKPEKRAIRVVQPPQRIHPLPPRHDAKSAVSRIQSRVMDHKSEIMQRIPSAAPTRLAPRSEPVRTAPRQAVRSNERVSAAPQRQAPAARSQRVSAVQREAIVPRRVAAPPVAKPAPAARPAPRTAANPARQAPQRAAASWSPRAAEARADTRAPARDFASPGARFRSR